MPCRRIVFTDRSEPIPGNAQEMPRKCPGNAQEMRENPMEIAPQSLMLGIIWTEVTQYLDSSEEIPGNDQSRNKSWA
jgi:hypothetical protein